MQNQVSKPSGGHIYFIDYLKALSILMVVFSHYDWSNKTNLFFSLIISMAVPSFMIISGYNFSMSYEKRNAHTLKELYNPSLLLHRLYRFLFPFVIIYIVEVLLHILIKGDSFPPSTFFYHLICGGLGPGSYYVPVLVVMLFTFPLIYLCVQRFSYLGVILVGAVHLLYEIYVRFAPMEKALYRLLFFRYLLFVALGCYLYFSKNRERYPVSKIVLVLMFLVGLSFSVSVYQLGFHPPIFQYWTKTAMPMALYIFPIIFVLMKYLGYKEIPGILGRGLSKIGSASYHIFLVQMVYYRLFDDIIFPPTPVIPVVIGNIVISLVIGYGYYCLESKLSKKILKK